MSVRQLAIDWAWLVCLLAALEVPALFLHQNHEAPPGYRAWRLPGPESRVFAILFGVVGVGLPILLVVLLIFFGWRVAAFVCAANLVALAINEVLALPSCYLLGEGLYRIVAGPVLWALAAVVLIILR